MKSITKAAITTSAAVCATLLSPGWSEQRGPSLSVESAQARVGRPLTPVSGAGVARRNYRRAAYGGHRYQGYGVAGAAAVGTAVAVGTAAAVANSPNYYGGTGCYPGNPYCMGGGYYAGGYHPGVWGAQAAYSGAAPAAATEPVSWSMMNAYHSGGPWYSYNGWDDYKTRNGIVCTPGTWTKGDDGLQYLCQ